MAMKLRVVVPPHELINHWLTVIRSISTPAPIYATGLEQLGRWLTYEALRDWLPHRLEKIQTAHTSTEGSVIESSVTLLAIPNHPGGIELWHGGRDVLPNAQLCVAGVPKNVPDKSGIIIYMDQINDGDELLKSLIALESQDVATKRIRVITAIASKDGLKKVGDKFKELTIYC